MTPRLCEARPDELSRRQFKVSKKALGGALRESLTGVLGKPSRAAGLWTYETATTVGPILTHIDLAARWPVQLRYWHEVPVAAPVEVVGAPSAVLRLNGLAELLGAGQSEWTYLTDDAVESTAGLLARVCAEFRDAIPGIYAEARRTV